MSVVLRLIGGVILTLSILGLIATLIIVFVVSARSPDAVQGQAAALFGSIGALWVWSGALVTGTILYVGGRALSYMDAGGRRATRGPQRRPGYRGRRRSLDRAADRSRRNR